MQDKSIPGSQCIRLEAGEDLGCSKTRGHWDYSGVSKEKGLGDEIPEVGEGLTALSPTGHCRQRGYTVNDNERPLASDE